MKKLKLLSSIILLGSVQFIAQQMEAVYAIDYKTSAITPSNGYHACIENNKTNGDGIY